MKILLLVLTAVAAYFLGGINGAIIISKYVYHKDIRNYGSGNAGLTNYFRTFGGVNTLLVIGIDILKSVLACLIGGWLLGFVGAPVVGKLFGGFCLIMGHMYPIYYQFRGGKGALCGVVMATAVDWRVGLGCLAVFVIVVVFTHYVSLGSMLGALACPVLLWVFQYGTLEGVLGLLCALLIVVKHGENILRLIGGTERRLNLKSGPARTK